MDGQGGISGVGVGPEIDPGLPTALRRGTGSGLTTAKLVIVRAAFGGDASCGNLGTHTPWEML